MKTKHYSKATAIIAGFILVTILAVTPVLASAKYQESDKGLQFTGAEVYTTYGNLQDAANTFEAWIYLPSSHPAATRGGVILGNYMASGVSCVSFEIYTNYNPRLYWNNSGTVTNYVFTQVAVPLGIWTHLAIVRDEAAGSVLCYVNGELAQTLDLAGSVMFNVDMIMGIGGDLRTGNAQYFKGSICEAAIFYNPRTVNQILSDMVEVDDSASDLFGHWIFKDAEVAGVDLSGHENHIDGLYKKEEETTTPPVETTTSTPTSSNTGTTKPDTPEETETESATAPATEPNETTKAPDKKGCKSSVSLPFILATLLGGAYIVRKRK